MKLSDDPVQWNQLDCDFWRARDRLGRPIGDYEYKYLSYAGLLQRMRAFEYLYPDVVTLQSAQDAFDLPVAGRCHEDDWRPEESGCRVWILSIGLRNETNPEIPQVFVSGALHGDERIGPTAVVEAAATLLAMDAAGDDWAQLLVRRRRMVLVPAANAIGYAKGVREELGQDPNRDFAYDTTPERCMRTVAARSLDALWRSQLFQLMLTLHGGDNLLGYPWGDVSHCPAFPAPCAAPAPAPGPPALAAWIAPDHSAMTALARVGSLWAGPLPGPGGAAYRWGPLNDPKVIYPVGGGMEDWAYAASWGPRPVRCRGGAGYGPATHRAANLLAETAHVKAPPPAQLGSSAGVLQPARADGAGHVPRNVRLLLAVLELARPAPRVLGTWPGPAGDVVWVEWAVRGALRVDAWTLACLPQPHPGSDGV